MGRKTILLGLLLCVLLAAGGCTEPAEPAAPAVPEAPAVSWEPVTVTTDQQGAPCLALSAETFCQRYNDGYEQAWACRPLPELAQWMAYGEGSNAYFGGAEGRQYVSLSDEENYAEPFLALCLSPEEDQVREIVTGLSQKNYAEGPGELFQEKTFYAMQALFPDLDRAGFDRFYQAVFSGGDYGAAGQEALPICVFLRDGVACYGTLRIGECDQIHLRAADQALLDQWQAAGVEIVQGLP